MATGDLELAKSLTPGEWDAISRSKPTQAAYLARILRADKGRNSLWFFANDILKIPVLYAPFHKPICDWADNWATNKKLALFPRGHVKSNLLTIASPLQEVCKDPNVRILLTSHKTTESQKFLRTIRNYVENHQGFRETYPEIRPAGSKGRTRNWNEAELLFQRDSTVTENTIETNSLEALVTGRHYDRLHADDIVTHLNVMTPPLIQRTQDAHEHWEALLDPGGRELMCGTRYDYSDEYGRLMDTPDLAAEWDSFMRPAVSSIEILHEFLAGRAWTREDDFKYVAFPLRFTLDDKDYRHPTDPMQSRLSLPKKYRVLGSTTYANQYMLDPFDRATAIFKEDDIQWIERSAFESLQVTQRLTYMRGSDLSSEKANKDSFTAIVSAAIDDRSNIYVYDIYWGQFEGLRVTQELIRGQQVPIDRRPIAIAQEPGPYERSLKPYVERAAREQGVFVPMRYIPMAEHEKTKSDTIMSIQPFLESRKVFIVKGIRHAEKLVEELVRFPSFNRKDIIDAFAKILLIMFPSRSGAFLLDIPAAAAPVHKPEVVTMDKLMAQMTARNSQSIGNERVNIRLAEYSA